MTNTNTDTEFLGTCPVCFSSHVVRKGVMVKHGWMEVGGREAGVYGKAYHSGECYAVGCVPYEVSCDTTKDFLNKVMVRRLADAIEYVAHLQTRPTLTVQVSDYAKDENGRIMYSGRKPVMVTTIHECTETNEFGSEQDYYGKTRYERELAKAQAMAESARTHLQQQVSFLQEKIATWKPAELTPYTGKVETVHYLCAGARKLYCGSRSYGVHSTPNADQVTCSRCLKALDTAARDRAARDQVKSDVQAVVAFLQGKGPVTAKVIKDGLGFDTKRLNKVLSKFDTGIKTDYDSKTLCYYI